MLVTDHDLLNVIMQAFLKCCEEKKNSESDFYAPTVKMHGAKSVPHIVLADRRVPSVRASVPPSGFLVPAVTSS